ncbi:MAG TPA: ribonuclease PH [Holophagaceae bacterium]|nr:ribonuclease PH [Holophagaceae bacterium]
MRDRAHLRPLSFELGVQAHPAGSCLIKVGNTHVLCAASLEEKVPSWMKGRGTGWLTAEYGLLPSSTHTRTDREAARGKQQGRTVEIQRLIGRSLRQAVDLVALGERTLAIDCDVLNADGGTRCAAITGGWVAVALALRKHGLDAALLRQVAAVSVGVVDDAASNAGEGRKGVLLDLDYEEDHLAAVDCNLVSARGTSMEMKLVEFQATGEGRSFTRKEHDALLTLGLSGCASLMQGQLKALQ